MDWGSFDGKCQWLEWVKQDCSGSSAGAHQVHSKWSEQLHARTASLVVGGSFSRDCRPVTCHVEGGNGPCEKDAVDHATMRSNHVKKTLPENLSVKHLRVFFCAIHCLIKAQPPRPTKAKKKSVNTPGTGFNFQVIGLPTLAAIQIQPPGRSVLRDPHPAAKPSFWFESCLDEGRSSPRIPHPIGFLPGWRYLIPLIRLGLFRPCTSPVEKSPLKHRKLRSRLLSVGREDG